MIFYPKTRNLISKLETILFKTVKLPPIWLNVLIERAHFFANNLMFVDLAAHTGAVLISSNIKQAAHKHIDIFKPDNYVSMLLAVTT